MVKSPSRVRQRVLGAPEQRRPAGGAHAHSPLLTWSQRGDREDKGDVGAWRGRGRVLGTGCSRAAGTHPAWWMWTPLLVGLAGADWVSEAAVRMR